MSNAAANSNRRVAFLKVIVASCLILSGSLLFGCKPSDVLTEHIEDPVNGTLDETVEPIYEDVPDADEDPDRTSSKSSDSDRLDDQKRAQPNYDEDVDDERETKERQQNPLSSNSQNATIGQLPSESSATTAVNSNRDSDEGYGTNNSTGEQPSDEASGGSVPGNNGTGGDAPTGGKGGTGKVYDSGDYTDLPTNVSSIAAVGQYATIIQMLCGKGGLAAADRKWLNSVNSSAVFSDEKTEGISSVRVGWSGDGTSAGSAKIETIISSDPDVVLYESESNSLTTAQQKQLESEGIDIVVGPKLDEVDTPDDDLVTAVNIVAEMLKKAKTTYDASAMAKTYTKLKKNTVDACLNANGGYSTKMVGGATYNFIYQGTSTKGQSTTNFSNNRYVTSFVDSWTTSVKSSSTATRRYKGVSLYLDGKTINASSGMGLSATGSTKNFMLLDYYFQVSGVMNNAYDTSRPALSNTGKTAASYMVIAGTGENLVSDESSYAQRSAPSALWFSLTGDYSSSSWTTVGDRNYPSLVCRDEDIAEKVTSSASRSNGLYNVGQSYEVWVMPTGFAGSWADGTVESFLAAPWAYCMFQLDEDLATCTEYADSFYETFYRCTAKDVLEGYGTTYKATCPVD